MSIRKPNDAKMQYFFFLTCLIFERGRQHGASTICLSSLVFMTCACGIRRMLRPVPVKGTPLPSPGG
ncbi:hypothetical protein SACS_0365 [Parasaccharibacter apium]|uniref:Uncharacterized protein n=1 Tax=Parasaccharibacter apium TaxID=1510841 RepID=A0A7U7G4P9_9PROT|nr:hypothetical protein SACS_0365 [Parasaccharibacter apium]